VYCSLNLVNEGELKSDGVSYEGDLLVYCTFCFSTRRHQKQRTIRTDPKLQWYNPPHSITVISAFKYKSYFCSVQMSTSTGCAFRYSNHRQL